MEPDLQVLVMVLTEKLEEPQDGLHDGHGWAHLGLHLLLLCSWLNGKHSVSWDGGDRLSLDQQWMTRTREDCRKGGGGSAQFTMNTTDCEV